MSLHIPRLGVIGVGLIGGSLARALRTAGCVGHVVGVSRDAAHLQRAQALGVIDSWQTEIAQGIKGCDVVVIAVPLGAMRSVMEQIKPILNDAMVVTDVGSAKGCVMADMQSVFGRVLPGFVPGHPIAGTEKSGVEAAITDLFNHRRVILTPLADTQPTALNTVREMWRACGAQVCEMSVEHHDEVLAATSHLPHMLAYALVDTLARMQERREIFEYAAGGFRDFTRIASSDPQMWHDICVHNREALLAMLDRFQDDLSALRQAVDTRDGQYLKDTFTRAKQARDKFCNH